MDKAYGTYTETILRVAYKDKPSVAIFRSRLSDRGYCADPVSDLLFRVLSLLPG